MTLKEDALALHKKLKGKIEIRSKIPVKSAKTLSLLYTPGVAEASKEIFREKDLVYDYTSKWNSMAIVTDGSRVLGLGNIGAEAALPVMEGKAILFKLFGGVDAYPICLETQDASEIIKIVKNISPTFGAINIEDIDSPKCFEIVDSLSESLDIPVFHDDQYGTGIVVLAALINACKLVKKDIKHVTVTIAGAGAAGRGIVRMLHSYGIRDLIVLDSKGIIYKGRGDLDKYKHELATLTNKRQLQGSLADALSGADVFIGVTGKGNMVNKNLIRKMNEDSIVFALANPDPEIMPSEAKKGGARIVATGRSDFPNQVNNSLAFPGILRGTLDVRARKINKQMMTEAALTLAKSVGNKLSTNYILPKTTDVRVHKKIARAVSRAAIETKVSRVNLSL